MKKKLAKLLIVFLIMMIISPQLIYAEKICYDEEEIKEIESYILELEEKETILSDKLNNRNKTIEIKNEQIENIKQRKENNKNHNIRKGFKIGFATATVIMILN